MYEPIAVNSRTAIVYVSISFFTLTAHRHRNSYHIRAQPSSHVHTALCPQITRLTTVDDGRPRSRLLRRLYCTTLMSSTVDNVCIHVHRHLDPRRRRPRRGQPLRPICTPVTTTRHTGTRDAEPRASSFLTSFHASATMRTSHKSYHPQTHVHHVFFGQTPYRPAEPGVPLPRRASPLVRYCGEALPHNHENNPLRHPRSGLLQPRPRPAFLNQAQL